MSDCVLRLSLPARRARRPLSRLLLALLVAGCLGAAARPAAAQQGGAASARSLPAFPGAEGYGAATVGGRGGRVLVVANRNDDGPGSLRAALEAAGPRIVIFRVGGVITLSSTIDVTSPYLTIAGQTAPGDGVVIAGAGIRLRAGEAIVRGLRFRVGDHPAGQAPSTRDGLAITGPAAGGGPLRNVIIDHCSISWAIDENLSMARAEQVTVQWTIISEGLNNSLHPKPHHSNGLLIAEGSRRISVHHNLIAHHWYRSPLIKGGTEVELLNNLIYNWGAAATLFEDNTGEGPSVATVAANTYRPGPSGRPEAALVIDDSAHPASQIYLADNSGADLPRAGLATLAQVAALPQAPFPVALDSAEAGWRAVLDEAGAGEPRRDPIDARVVREVRDGEGAIIDRVDQVGGWAVLAAWAQGAPPPDGDRDGMPDAWERFAGLDPRDPGDAALLAPSGYPWIEEYLNSLIAMPGARDDEPDPDPTAVPRQPTARPAPTATPAPDPAGEPAILNAGFEQRWRSWRFSSPGVGVGNMYPKAARGGGYGALIRGAGRIEQTIVGLRPGTTYELAGFVRSTSTRSRSGLQVSGFGGDTVEAYTSTGRYERLSLTFTTGRAATSATIAFVAPQSDDRIHFADDLTLTAVGE